MNISERFEFEARRNIHRDKKGRLNKGAQLAKKIKCDEYMIRRLYKEDIPVRTITLLLGCSKSTVYNVIKQYKKQYIKQNKKRK